MYYWPDKLVSPIAKAIFTGSSHRLSHKQKSDLEYAQRFPPYFQTRNMYGRIDFLSQVEPKKLVIRGWLFHATKTIQKISLELNDVTIPVYGIKLERSDVKAIYPQYSTSANSGFVAVLPFETGMIYFPFSIFFNVTTSSNEQISGHLLMF